MEIIIDVLGRKATIDGVTHEFTFELSQLSVPPGIAFARFRGERHGAPTDLIANMGWLNGISMVITRGQFFHLFCGVVDYCEIKNGAQVWGVTLWE